MTIYRTSDFEVLSEPKPTLFEELENWLLQEERETGDGFYCNLHLLKQSFEAQQMVLAKVEGQVVGFLTWYEYSSFGVYINIMEIRPSFRGRGLGKKLVQTIWNFFLERGTYIIDLECAPASSAGFWKKVGFGEFPESSRGWKFQASGHKRLYKILPEALEPSTRTRKNEEVFELWNDEAHLMKNEEPKWVWKLKFKIGTRELLKPIVHPADPEWRARWRKGDEVYKDGPVKRLLPRENTTGSFVVVTRIS